MGRGYWGFIWHWHLDIGFIHDAFIGREFLNGGISVYFIEQEASVLLCLIL